MSEQEATNLAAQIDKSHLPVHVKQVTCNGVVMIQDDQTGYTLPIVSREHWNQYAKQAGDSNAIDEFANAGLALLSTLDKVLEGLRFERDNLLSQAEQVDNQVTAAQQQRDAIEAAIKAADGLSWLTAMGGVKAPSPVTPTQADRPSPVRTKRPAGVPKQKDWIISKLHHYGQIKVGTLADEFIKVYNMSKERAIGNISGELSRQIQAHPTVYVRVENGVYRLATYTEEPTNG